MLEPLTLVAYALGAVGLAVEWRSYLLRCGTSFRTWSAVAALLWAGQYALLGGVTAAVTMASTGLRSLLSQQAMTGRRRHLAAAGFSALFAALTALSWQGPVSLLPLAATVNTTWALFYLDNKSMRVALLASSAAWIANDVLWQAWPALLAEAGAAALNIRTLWRWERSYPAYTTRISDNTGTEAMVDSKITCEVSST